MNAIVTGRSVPKAPAGILQPRKNIDDGAADTKQGDEPPQVELLAGGKRQPSDDVSRQSAATKRANFGADFPAWPLRYDFGSRQTSTVAAGVRTADATLY